MVEVDFPNMALIYCNTVQNPEIAAQNSIFAVPAILVYFDGKECIRKSRNIGVEELHELIKRPYALLFS